MNPQGSSSSDEEGVFYSNNSYVPPKKRGKINSLCRTKSDSISGTSAKSEQDNISGSEEEPSSSNPRFFTSTAQQLETSEKEKIKLKSMLDDVSNRYNKLLADLKESVECPVCFNIPRTPPVPCCKNGHLICQKCNSKCSNSCPTCRTSKTDCVSQIATFIIQRIDHTCEFRDEGCNFKGRVTSSNANEISINEHEENCEYRLVRCPHWACDESITARKLTHHVIAAECGDSYRDKPLPYREEMVYTQALDDEEGNGFWKPSLLQFDNITFFLQVEKCGKSKNWYFYIQMEGSKKDCEKYATMIKVSKNQESDRNSIVYNGQVCSIDVKGAAEVEACGAGLNIRDAAMERIFDINKEDGELEREFKFWVDVDIYKESQ